MKTLRGLLVVMLGADVGTSLTAVLFSFDLSWLSPLLIFGGVCVILGIQCVFFGLLAELVVVAGRRPAESEDALLQSRQAGPAFVCLVGQRHHAAPHLAPVRQLEPLHPVLLPLHGVDQLRGVHQRPAPLRELAEEAARAFEVEHLALMAA